MLRQFADAMLVIGICVLSIQLLPIALSPMNRPAGFLSSVGSTIVNNAGPISLRGVDYFGYDVHPLWPHSQAAYEMFAQAGFNIVRLPVNWAYLEPIPGTFNYTYLAMIDQDVLWAKQNNLYLLIDMHQWNWSQWFIDNGDAGNGAPVWTVTQYPRTLEGSQKAAHNFWSNATLQSSLISVWMRIATHYAGNPWIAGYDLFNEPRFYSEFGPVDPTSLTRFYVELIDNIRSVDSVHLLFMEPSEFSPQYIDRQNLVWSPHFYTLAFENSFNPTNSTATSLMAKSVATDYNQYVVKFGEPLWYGEFSRQQGPAPSDCAWDQYSIRLFQNYSIGWAWWAWGPEWGNMNTDFGCVQSAMMSQ